MPNYTDREMRKRVRELTRDNRNQGMPQGEAQSKAVSDAKAESDYKKPVADTKPDFSDAGLGEAMYGGDDQGTFEEKQDAVAPSVLERSESAREAKEREEREAQDEEIRRNTPMEPSKTIVTTDARGNEITLPQPSTKANPDPENLIDVNDPEAMAELEAEADEYLESVRPSDERVEQVRREGVQTPEERIRKQQHKEELARINADRTPKPGGLIDRQVQRDAADVARLKELNRSMDIRDSGVSRVQQIANESTVLQEDREREEARLAKIAADRARGSERYVSDQAHEDDKRVYADWKAKYSQMTPAEISLHLGGRGTAMAPPLMTKNGPLPIINYNPQKFRVIEIRDDAGDIVDRKVIRKTGTAVGTAVGTAPGQPAPPSGREAGIEAGTAVGEEVGEEAGVEAGIEAGTAVGEAGAGSALEAALEAAIVAAGGAGGGGHPGAPIVKGIKEGLELLKDLPLGAAELLKDLPLGAAENLKDLPLGAAELLKDLLPDGMLERLKDLPDGMLERLKDLLPGPDTILSPSTTLPIAPGPDALPGPDGVFGTPDDGQGGPEVPDVLPVDTDKLPPGVPGSTMTLPPGEERFSELGEAASSEEPIEGEERFSELAEASYSEEPIKRLLEDEAGTEEETGPVDDDWKTGNEGQYDDSITADTGGVDVTEFGADIPMETVKEMQAKGLRWYRPTGKGGKDAGWVEGAVPGEGTGKWMLPAEAKLADANRASRLEKLALPDKIKKERIRQIRESRKSDAQRAVEADLEKTKLELQISQQKTDQEQAQFDEAMAAKDKQTKIDNLRMIIADPSISFKTKQKARVALEAILLGDGAGGGIESGEPVPPRNARQDLENSDPDLLKTLEEDIRPRLTTTFWHTDEGNVEVAWQEIVGMIGGVINKDNIHMVGPLISSYITDVAFLEELDSMKGSDQSAFFFGSDVTHGQIYDFFMALKAGRMPVGVN